MSDLKYVLKNRQESMLNLKSSLKILNKSQQTLNESKEQASKVYNYEEKFQERRKLLEILNQSEPLQLKKFRHNRNKILKFQNQTQEDKDP
jgi:hypothetical protein